MKNESGGHTAVCPLCGESYSGHPALSRTDDRMEICPDCGIRQALESINVRAEEREEILRIIKGTRKLGDKPV